MRAKMVSCVTIVQNQSKKDQMTYELMAMQHGYTANALMNKLIADQLEKCFNDLPDEEAARIGLLRDEYVTEHHIRPYFIVDPQIYASSDADLEVTE